MLFVVAKPLGRQCRYPIVEILVSIVLLASAGCERKVKVRVAGIETTTMNYYAAKQSEEHWCWAACVQMVLAARGIHLSQEEISQRTFGHAMNRPAGIEAVCANLSEWQVQHNGTKSRLTALMGLGPPPPELMIKNLPREIPITVVLPPPYGDVGHAVVITAVFYREVGDRLDILGVSVRDPDSSFAGRKGKRELTPEEYGSITAYVVVTEQ